MLVVACFLSTHFVVYHFCLRIVVFSVVAFPLTVDFATHGFRLRFIVMLVAASLSTNFVARHFRLRLFVIFIVACLLATDVMSTILVCDSL
jgi:hypothetical protein